MRLVRSNRSMVLVIAAWFLVVASVVGWYSAEAKTVTSDGIAGLQLQPEGIGNEESAEISISVEILVSADSSTDRTPTAVTYSEISTSAALDQLFIYAFTIIATITIHCMHMREPNACV